MFTSTLALVLATVLAVQDRPVEVKILTQPDKVPVNEHYVGSRLPLLPTAFVKLPIGCFEPQGWLRRQLELEAEGFTGRLHELSRFLKKEGNAWLNPQGEGHSYWEEVPYWLKGFIDLGYLLEDERIISEAHRWVEATIASQRADGWFGPRPNLRGEHSHTRGKPDLWPNMIMLFVLQSYYEKTQDPRVIELMRKYFRWELNVPDEDFLPPFWQQQRAGDNLYAVYWLYNRTGDRWLLQLAAKIKRNMADWFGGIPSWHGVNIAQCFRTPAVYFLQSHDVKHLAATERNYRTVIDIYGQVPGGMFGADENCRPGHTGARQAAESCAMAEMMLSHEILASITGDSKWADRCEEVAFNSFPACMTADLKALHYLTAPNMPLCDAGNKSPGLQNRGIMLMFDPWRYRCCQHNIGHGWPKFAQHTIMATAHNGLAAVLYAPIKVTAKAGDGATVTITEQTRYPFQETIDFVFTTERPVKFPFLLRIPSWCNSAKLYLNDQPLEAQPKPGGFVSVTTTWQSGDRLRLELPMQIRIVRWKAQNNAVSVYRGPLAYSLRIGEVYVQAGGTDRWPAWEVYPSSPWNYALVLDEQAPATSFRVIERGWPGDDQPFEATVAPVELLVPAKRIPDWTLDELGLVGPLPASPVQVDTPVETVTLIPMGCARLRISVFPVAETGKQ